MRQRAIRRLSRGAATVETVLGVLVMVPVLFYGIHFTELGIASMKVFEAGAAPVWEATAYPQHVMGVRPSHQAYLDQAIEAASVSAAIRYGTTFDGRLSEVKKRLDPINGTGLTETPFMQLFTVAKDLNVGCARARASPGPALEYAPLFVSMVIPDTNGFACRAEAKAINVMPRYLFNTVNGGLSEAELNARAGQFTRLCPIGRPDGLGGPCRGAFAMLTDDWGLANAEFPASGSLESDACTVTFGVPGTSLPCENMSYYTVTRSLYELHTLPFILLRSPHRSLVAATVGGTPWLMSSDTSFYMAFRGDETLFNTITPTSDWTFTLPNDFMIWQTTPFSAPGYFYASSWLARSKCYLGIGGC